MKRILIPTLIFVFIATSAIAGPRGPRRGPGPDGPGPERMRGEILGPEQFHEFLGLTEAQITQVEPLRETMRSTVEPLREQQRANHEEIRAAIDAGNTTKAAELMAANRALGEQIKAAHDAFKTSFEALLTSEQKAKYAVYDEILQLRRERRPE